MDGSRFDRLARSLAGSSRRSVLKAAFGAALATAGLAQGAEAAVLRAPGEICRKDGDCTSNLCGPRDRTGRRYCQCVTAADCPQPKSGDVCHIAACTAGICGIGVNVGAPCNDGNLCTTDDACDANGSCVGTPVDCNDNDACTVDTCDPAVGCVYSAVADDQAGACPSGQVCCGGACTDTSTNASHCGSCAAPCPTGATCIGSVCSGSSAGTCTAGTDYCFTGTATTCNGDESCICHTSVSGNMFCGSGPAVCADCNTDADCVTAFAAGWACLELGTNCSVCFSNTPTHVCQGPCPTAA